ncbi:hypothetical protein YTPLAS73_08990 [Nitrosarchaeum sp.]|nr:hypothetical protein YTPLAS73_08990 [Nitrosarchaeum sp.]
MRNKKQNLDDNINHTFFKDNTITACDDNENMSSSLTNINKIIRIGKNKEDNSNHIKILQQEIDWIKNNLSDKTSPLHQIYLSNKKDVILHWAYCLEELSVLGVYKEPIDSISNYIRKELIAMDLKKAIPYVYEVLPSKFKHHVPNPDLGFDGFDGILENDGSAEFLGDPKKNDSLLLPRTTNDSLILESLDTFKEYHMWWKRIVEVYENHLKDPNIHQDFANSLKWQEIAKFCSALGVLYGPMSILQQILDEGNIKQSATMFQKAMCVMFGADTSFRQWAYKFGVSPRQHQRIRERLADWPKKDVAKIIQNVTGSYCCPSCNYNLIERKQNKKKQARKPNPKQISKNENSETNLEIPKKMEGKGLNPLEIAERIWKGKLKHSLRR